MDSGAFDVFGAWAAGMRARAQMGPVHGPAASGPWHTDQPLGGRSVLVRQVDHGAGCRGGERVTEPFRW